MIFQVIALIPAWQKADGGLNVIEVDAKGPIEAIEIRLAHLGTSSSLIEAYNREFVVAWQGATGPCARRYRVSAPAQHVITEVTA